MSYDIKATDDTPALQFRIANADGSIPDLTGATITMKLVRRADGVAVVTGGAMTAVAPAATSGLVQYAFPLNGFATAGVHDGEISVTFSNGRHATYPGKGTIEVNINAKL